MVRRIYLNGNERGQIRVRRNETGVSAEALVIPKNLTDKIVARGDPMTAVRRRIEERRHPGALELQQAGIGIGSAGGCGLVVEVDYEAGRNMGRNVCSVHDAPRGGRRDVARRLRTRVNTPAVELSNSK